MSEQEQESEKFLQDAIDSFGLSNAQNAEAAKLPQAFLAGFLGCALLILGAGKFGKNFFQGFGKKPRSQSLGPWFPSEIETLWQRFLTQFTHLGFASSLSAAFTSEPLAKLLQLGRFKKVPETALLALGGIYSSGWPVQIFSSIPSAERVLDLQRQGCRPISLLVQNRERKSSFDFLVHDLDHVYSLHQYEPTEQVRFFKNLKNFLIAHPDFVSTAKKIKTQGPETLEYLMSDMNSHPQHLILQFRALAIKVLKKQEDDAAFLSAQAENLLNLWLEKLKA